MVKIFRNYFSDLILLCGLIVTALILYSAVFSFPNLGFGDNTSFLDVSAVLLIFIFTTFLVFWFLNYFSSKVHSKELFFLLLFFMAVQIFFVVSYHVIPNTDTGYIFLQSQNLAQNHFSWSHYFAVYPNNVNIAIFWSGIYRIGNLFSIGNLALFGSYFQLFLLDLSILFLSYVLKKFYSFKIAATFAIFSFLFVPLTFFVLPVYSDLISIVILFSSISFLILALQDSGEFKRFLFLFFLTVTLILGYFLRTNLIVIVIALFLTIFLTKRFSFKNKILFLITFAFSFLFLFSFFSTMQRANKFTPQPNAVTPALRYVYMGLNPTTQGEINGTDAWKFETQGYSKTKKNKLYRKAINERLKGYDSLGLIHHLIDKVNFMFSSGTFNQDLGLLANKNGSESWQVRHLFIWTNIFHGFYVLMFVLLSYGCFSHFRKKQDDPLFIFSILSVLGIFSFQVIFWEVRDRYMLPMIPFVLLASAFSKNDFDRSKMAQHFNNAKNSLLHKGWLALVLALGVFSCFSFLRNYNLTERIQVYTDFVQIQPFQRYAGLEDFDLPPQSRYSFPIHLKQPANLFQLPYRSYEKGFQAELIFQKNGRKYQLNNGQNRVAGRFPAGKYSLIVQNTDHDYITTRMIVNAGTANMGSASLQSRGHNLIPTYEFDRTVERPLISRKGLAGLIFGPYLLSVLLWIPSVRKRKI
ncbi:hypothetical protein [Oenococcus sp.]|uniref:hypothetical protein n=1 Tax=Oenococcus sp. TaxID=1979414 RepID=UPI0039EC0EB3